MQTWGLDLMVDMLTVGLEIHKGLFPPKLF